MTKQLPTQPETTPVAIYNPTLEDFRVLIADDFNIQHEYVVPAQEFVEFPKYIADHIAKKIADKVIGDRGVKTNHEDDYKEILKEIYLKDE